VNDNEVCAVIAIAGVLCVALMAAAHLYFENKGK
jgi:hypothetical protein